jgi:hypothetical protein
MHSAKLTQAFLFEGFYIIFSLTVVIGTAAIVSANSESQCEKHLNSYWIFFLYSTICQRAGPAGRDYTSSTKTTSLIGRRQNLVAAKPSLFFCYLFSIKICKDL